MEELLTEGKKNIQIQPLAWEGHEYIHFEKTSEWFWALGLLGVAGAVAALAFENILFAIFILIAAFVLAIFAARKPEEVSFKLTQRGVYIDQKLYPFQSLKSFGIEEFSPKHIPTLIVESKKMFMPDLIIPLATIDIDEVHDFMLNFLPEEDHEEPLTHRFMEWLGF